jgi:hypothetical protein
MTPKTPHERLGGRSSPRMAGFPSDLLLNGLAVRLTDGYTDGVRFELTRAFRPHTLSRRAP